MVRQFSTLSSLELFAKTKEKVYVLFYASWCPYCRAFLPIYEKIFEADPGQFVCAMVDDDDGLCSRYSVYVVPTGTAV